mgnify:CR=1 FL=1
MSKASESAAAKKAAEAAKASTATKVIIGKITRRAHFAADLNDCIPSSPVILGSRLKETGNWLTIGLEGGQVLMVNSGELAAMHNDGKAKIFEEAKLEEGAEGTFLPNLTIGIKAKELIFGTL